MGGSGSMRGNSLMNMMSNPMTLLMMNAFGIDPPDLPAANARGGAAGSQAGGFLSALFGNTQPQPRVSNSWSSAVFDPVLPAGAGPNANDPFGLGTADPNAGLLAASFLM
ncbi:uncharacterized protein LOC124271355 [Haliotis rubra]|uniref:uncharacterized protein LOC124271355 n=1 Tax=Haliotis rubra TaxID=36100 RepID=UPI001EE5399E|nr:uncharacterized protein LOC124271355 [Haliotis rubra]